MPATLVLASVPRFTLIRTASVLSPSSVAASATVTVPTHRSSIILVKAQSPGSPLIAQVSPL